MKVTRKVGRRSRRRLRNKKSRSGYKKRYAKTHKGGTRSRKYGHKRGKRFHREERVSLSVMNLRKLS